MPWTIPLHAWGWPNQVATSAYGKNTSEGFRSAWCTAWGPAAKQTLGDMKESKYRNQCKMEMLLAHNVCRFAQDACAADCKWNSTSATVLPDPRHKRRHEYIKACTGRCTQLAETLGFSGESFGLLGTQIRLARAQCRTSSSRSHDTSGWDFAKIYYYSIL